MNANSLPLRWYVYQTVTLAVGMAVSLAAWTAYPVRDWLPVIWFTLLGIATNLFLIPTGGTSVISLSDAVFLAAPLVLGPAAGAFVIVASVTAGTLGRLQSPRRRPLTAQLGQWAGNTGMYLIMITAAMGVYAQLGGRFPLARLGADDYFAALGFIAAYEVINRAILYTSFLLRGLSILADLRDELETLPLEVLNLHIGLLIALTYAASGWGPLVIFGVAILLISLLLRRRVAMSEQLQRQVTQLGALNEIGRAISAMMDIPHLVNAIYRESSQVIDTRNFYIALYTADKDEVTFTLNVTGGQVSTAPVTRRGGRGLTEHVIRTRAPLLLPDNVGERSRTLGIEPMGKEAQCWLGVPLIAGEQVLGMLAAQSYEMPHAFTGEHQMILTTIAAQAAIAIANARLLETVAQQERLRRELELARAIQQNLLPPPPKIPGLFVAGRCLPAQETGGDLYDFIPVDERHLGVAIGDVTGKGVPAALLMATAHSLLRAYAPRQLDPAAVLEAVNRALYADTQGKTYITLCYLVLDTHEWTLIVANGGHPSPLWCGQHAEPVYLDSRHALPLGIRPDLSFSQHATDLQPGQALLLYTDGALEVHNAQRQMLSFEGLQSLVAGQPGECLMDAIIGGITRFAGTEAQEDDVTLVVIERIV